MNPRAGALLLALLLVTADLVRPVLPPGVPVLQAALVVVALGFAWIRVSRNESTRGDRWALMTLAILFAYLYLRHTRALSADGIQYFAFARSLLVDRDLDLTNDYAVLHAEAQIESVLPIGAPLVFEVLLIPLYVVMSVLGAVRGVSVTGGEGPFIAAACLVSIGFGCAGLYLLYRELRTFVPPLAALVAVLLVWFGSPLRFYMRVLPPFAHAIEFFGGALVLITCRRLLDDSSTRRGVEAGLACGFIYLVRSQDGLLLAAPAIFLIDSWARTRDTPRLFRQGFATLGGFAALAWIQSAVWWVMFGTPFLIPHKVLHGEGFVTPETPKLLESLFSDRGGLFSTYPILLLAVIALPFAWRRHRAWTLAAFAVLALQWRLNASIFDWYQVRRFTGTVPLLALGLAMVTPSLARAGVIVTATLLALTHQYDVAIDALRPYAGKPVTIQAALKETADSMAEMAYASLEPFAPRAAVAALDGYTGSSLLAESRSDLDIARDEWWMRLPRLSRRFSAVETEDGSLCRWVDGKEARLYLPLRGSGELRISFEIRAIETETPQKFEALVNGRSLGVQEIAPMWQTVRFSLPADAWHSGTNEIVLRFEQAPNFFHVRGTGERAFRAAALRKITFHTGS